MSSFLFCGVVDRAATGIGLGCEVITENLPFEASGKNIRYSGLPDSYFLRFHHHSLPSDSLSVSNIFLSCPARSNGPAHAALHA
jgi:hypothetical protein